MLTVVSARTHKIGLSIEPNGTCLIDLAGCQIEVFFVK